MIEIAHLADHREALPVLRRWFETEWQSYYGPGGPGDAEADLAAFASRDKLPIGMLAFVNGELCGIAALKAESIATHSYLCPWAAAGLVTPAHRRKGIGAQLLAALEEVARGLGYARIYCGTSTSVSLLYRSGWHLLEKIDYYGARLHICEKELKTSV